jgi:hypothetical protein
MSIPTEETNLDRRLWLSVLSALLFFANPIVLSLAGFWERIVSDPLAALLLLQLEGVYALLALVAGGAIGRKRPIVWLWLVPVILAAVILCAQIAFTLYRRLTDGVP